MQRIVITGGSSGIGLGIIKEILSSDESAEVVSISRSEEKIAVATREIGPGADKVQFLSADVSDPYQVVSAVEKITARSKSVDGLVNCAGVLNATGLQDTDYDEWRRVIDANLNSTFLMMRSIVPFMKERGGSIVNISSVSSLRPAFAIAYSTSKAAVDMLTRCAAKELGPLGIRVNCVNPGTVATDLHRSAEVVDDIEAWSTEMASKHPLGRIGMPEDIAGAVLYLLGSGSMWTTGAIISVDGGRSLWT